ncbi:MAG TPA: HNH endonuclease [Egibacteraceae bacterium]|nr:HNH endonuclease [Egibacteraceae bacterium]
MAVVDELFEHRARQAAFDFLNEAQRTFGDVLTTDVLRKGVEIDGRRIPIFDLYRGIHKPAVLRAALSFVTTPPKPGGPPPYEDQFTPEGWLAYRYRTPDSNEYENAALRLAHEHRLPCVYFFGITPGHYLPQYPVHVVVDDPIAQRFLVDLSGMGVGAGETVVGEDPERRYRNSIVKHRLHQARFREAVLHAYVRTCAFCRLRRPELVEAAHIVGDARGGPPVVPNGVTLCRLHHAAFDRHLMGIRPDLRIVVRSDVLSDTDGPMLTHGLQDLNGRELYLPRQPLDRPGAEYLERRYEEFKAAS